MKVTIKCPKCTGKTEVLITEIQDDYIFYCSCRTIISYKLTAKVIAVASLIKEDNQ